MKNQDFYLSLKSAKKQHLNQKQQNINRKMKPTRSPGKRWESKQIFHDFHIRKNARVSKKSLTSY